MTIIYINLLALFYESQKRLSSFWNKFCTGFTRPIIRRLDLGCSFTLASYIYWFYHKFHWLGISYTKLLNQLAAENYQFIFNRPANKNLYSHAWRIKHMLDKYVYYENPYIIEQMRNIAKLLDKEIANIESKSKTPILSPLHMCSDMLAAMICSMVKPYSTTVVSIYQEDYFGLNENEFFIHNHQSLLRQVNPEKASTKLARSLKKTQNRQENIVIFPDALPQITESIVGYSMPTKPIKIFNRAGRLYSGIDRITTKLDAEVIFFYLYWENHTIKLRTFPPVNKQNLTAKTTEYIETALTEHPTEWFLWHIPNLFYLNTDN